MDEWLNLSERYRDVNEVLEGLECGIVLENFQDIKKDDLIQIYKIEEIARKL